ncbi:MAG: ABC transporter ATP-binding protein [Deltaproteobacteria bacterium]|nr:ABC transporter ATP-binding protein [Deltaproteobacteria bacterium]
MVAAKTPMLELRDIYKSFGDVEVLKGISARIDKGELLTFVGPSGCGKTTLLRIVGGFTSATSGQVILDGEDIGKLPPNMRNTKMVFQSYALFPHMNVRKNIGFGLKLQKWPKEKIDDRVDELLALVHMEGLGDRTIDRISGGQQQRVALARALALEPKVLLLDEPLSNLDANLRVAMRAEIRNIQERIGVTTIFVTHDQYEAMSISDRLLVLNEGIIQQIGSPIDIYEQPANEFIAGFVGYVNFLEGTVKAIDDETNTSYVTTDYGKLELDHDQEDIKVGDEILLVIRPETVSLSPSYGIEQPNTFHGTVESQMYAGNLAKYTVKFGEKEMVVDHYNPMGSKKYRKNDKVSVTVPRAIHVLKRKGASTGLSE